MLDKRANILLSQPNWDLLSLIAEQKDLSVSELIRQAIRQTFLSEAENLKTQKAFNNILHLRKNAKGRINYRQLIENGRKY